MNYTIHNLLKKIVYLGLDKKASDVQKDKYKLLISLTGLVILEALLWGVLCLWHTLFVLGLVSFGYVLLSILNMYYLYLTKNQHTTGIIQLGASLFLPFLLQWGFEDLMTSGLVILWSGVALAGVIIIYEAKYILWWFILYVLLILFSIVIDLYSTSPPLVSPAISYFLLISNLFGVSSTLIFLLASRIKIDNVAYQKIKQQKTELETKKKELTNTHHNLSMAHKELQEANSIKDGFLAKVSHEIRTPLNAISGFSQLLLQDSIHLPLNKNFKEYLHIVYQNSQNLADLIENLLFMSKIDHEQTTPQCTSTNLKTFVQIIYHIHKENAKAKKQHFSYHIDAQLPQFINIDQRLGQAVNSLLSNAIKFTPIQGNITLRIIKKEGFILFQVEDTGIGIAPGKQSQIFAAFEQIEQSASGSYPGIGLGLTVAKKIVYFLNGKIEIHSKPDQGSLFTIKLPLVTAIEKIKPDQKTSIKTGSFQQESPILIAEDNLLNQKILTVLLNRMNLTDYIVVEDGNSAVRVANESIPQLILMDMHMPEMNGLEVAQKIKENPRLKHIPIIMISADTVMEKQHKIHRNLIAEYIVKPIEFEKLEQVFEQYLSHQQQQEIALSENILTKDNIEEILKELEFFANIPHFSFGEMLSSIQKMKQIMETYHVQELDKLEDAIYIGNKRTIQSLIHQIKSRINEIKNSNY